jgi:hypothetical protein
VPSLNFTEPVPVPGKPSDAGWGLTSDPRDTRTTPEQATSSAHSAAPLGGGADTETVLIDDVRRFRDGRPCQIARSSPAGVALLEQHRHGRIHHLWLDHDLVGDDDIWPVIHLLENASLAGEPFQIGLIHIHASRSGPAHRMGISLRRIGYPTERTSDLRLFTW